MRLIRPTTITPAMLTACNVPETDYAAWNSGTAYVVGNNCMYNHKNYECAINHTNAQPDLNVAPVVSPKWIDLGYNNRWKMFDNTVGSQTELAEAITLTLAPGAVIDSIAFLDLDATAIEITMTDPIEGVVFSDTIDLVSHSGIIDAYTYFFNPIITDDTAILLGIPPYGSASIAITINNPGGTAKIGTLVVGLQQDVGGTQYNPTVGFDSYSRIKRDDFGNMEILARGYSNKLSCTLSIPKASHDYVLRTFKAVRDLPIVWVGVDAGYSSMIVYGIIKSCPIGIPGPVDSICHLEIEGFV